MWLERMNYAYYTMTGKRTFQQRCSAHDTRFLFPLALMLVPVVPLCSDYAARFSALHPWPIPLTSLVDINT